MIGARLALALRHVAFEDCGTLQEILTERGLTVRYVDVGRESLRDLDVEPADLIVGLGGPIAVYDEERYPWISEELALLARALTLRKPVLGICLGAQLLARTLGARVYPGPVREIGWKPLELTAAGSTSVIATLAGDLTSMLHWHGDTFELPRGATLLASTREVPNQVFMFGENLLAFQCHPEIRAVDIESWLIGHAHELAGNKIDIRRLRAETRRLAPVLKMRARPVFERWLTSVGL